MQGQAAEPVSSGGPQEGGGARGRPELVTWLVTFVVATGLCLCWAVASPIYSGPDEPAHAERAYSVAHGTLVGEEPGDPTAPGLVVDVPEALADTSPACFAFQPAATAECLKPEAGTASVATTTNAGRHPPLYYGLVGIGSWFSDTTRGLFYMRALSAALTGALLASAMVTARRRWASGWMPVGLLVAATPMVFYLSGLVNPSGLEIAAAIGAWVHGLTLVAERDVDRRVLVRFVVAAAFLATARQLGPLWLAGLVATMVLLAGWAGTRRLLRQRSVLVAAGAVAVVTMLQLAWIVIVKPLDASRSGMDPVTIPTSDIQRGVLGRVGLLFREGVAVIGWRDTAAPELVYFAWLMAGAALVFAALAIGARRAGYVLLALVAASVIVPIALEYPGVRRADYFWQGRYTLPLVVGIPLVAAFSLARSRAARSSGGLAVPVAVVLLGVAHVLAFGQALRRYSVGANGSIWFFTVDRWSPPLPSVLLLVVHAALVGAWCALAAWRRAVFWDPTPQAVPPAEDLDPVTAAPPSG